MGTSQKLYRKAKTLIPGGTQLLSKRPEMFLPEYWPAYYSKSKGCEVWDLDNKKYTDMSYMGIGSCTIGYADQTVDQEVIKAIHKGSMNTLNAPEEVELAELLIALHPWAEMVRYARTGGEAMSIAVRLARASTKRDVIIFSGYHGWHDWYLSANLADDKSLDGHLLPGLNPLGVPRGLKGLSFPFAYNDTEAFLRLIETHRGNIGAIVLESVRNFQPEKQFISKIVEIAQEQQIPIIVDEITAGWRLNLGGAHLLYDLKPDIAVFAKGMSNGYPMAAIIGKKHVMEAAQDSFVSSTYWTERIGPVAALATIKFMKQKKVQKHLIAMGAKVKQGWKECADTHGLNIHISGIDPLGHFDFEYPNKLEIKTLFTQTMLEKGFLATTAFYASYAHTEQHVKRYIAAVDQAFEFIKQKIDQNNVMQALKGPVCHSGFKRLT